jgi:hypothetical protein
MAKERKPNRKLTSDKDKPDAKNKVDVRVWRFDRKEERPAEEENDKNKRKKIVTTSAPKASTGKRLWIKGTPDGAVKMESAPAGYEKHREVTKYIVEEQEKERELRTKARMERLAMQKKRPRPPRKEIVPETPQEVVKLDPINVVFTVAMGKRPFQKLIERLVESGVETLIDLRNAKAMYSPGISSERDLAILLKEMAGIDYRRDEVLLPSREMVQRYEQDKNWTRFVGAYSGRLQKLKAEEILDRNMFVKKKTAFLGELPDPGLDQRHIVAAYLKAEWEIATVIEII